MALRSLVGKLRIPPALVAASRAFSHKCEHCGKTSSRIGAKDDWSEEFKRFQRKEYMIRIGSGVAAFSILGISGKYTLYLLETGQLPKVRRRK
ncbi:hypothetical protein SETIT_2G031900v2 [Setaria italica]|uniref:Uncharacterized protein n=1 Tax=Setaria italica TaxID=4555 RepID=K3ZYH0_SETIT|nr:hypothetical protein SETIT_2G031900v2 [Setaria italica]